MLMLPSGGETVNLPAPAGLEELSVKLRHSSARIVTRVECRGCGIELTRENIVSINTGTHTSRGE